MADPSYVNSGTGSAVALATVSPALPASLVVGNVLLMLVHSRTNGAHSITTNPQDWAEVTPQNTTGTAGRLSLWWRRVAASNLVPTVTQGGTAECLTAQIHQFTNCKTTGNPWNATSLVAAVTSGAPFNLPAVTTGAGGCRVVSFAGIMDNGVWTAGGGYTIGAQTPNGSGSDNLIAMQYGNAVVAAGTYTPAASCTLSPDAGWAVTLALQPGATQHEITGTVAGAATLEGSPTKTVPMTGTVAGQATLSGGPVRQVEEGGTAAGAATLSGELDVQAPAGVTHELAGTVAGQATLSGAPTKEVPLGGTVAAGATLSGDPRRQVELGGTAAGAATLSGDPARSVPLAGDVAAAAALEGEPSVSTPATHQLDGTAAIAASLSGELSVSSPPPAPVVEVAPAPLHTFRHAYGCRATRRPYGPCTCGRFRGGR